MLRVVLDTNVLINAQKGAGSYPQRILDLIKLGKIKAVVSHPVWRENQLIVKRLIKDNIFKQEILEFLDSAERVEPELVPTMLEDPEDHKLLDAAVGGQAQFLITEDRHLLEVGEWDGVKIIKPLAFWQWWEAEQGGSWQNWIRNIFTNH